MSKKNKKAKAQRKKVNAKLSHSNNRNTVKPVKATNDERIRFMESIHVKLLFSAIVLAVVNLYIENPEVLRIFYEDENRLVLHYILRAIAFVFSVVILYVLQLKIWQMIYSPDKKVKNGAIFFGIYLAINLCILLLVWPGIFKGDEFYTMPKVINMKNFITWQQSWITCVFYKLSLMILPYLVGITFHQIIIICIIASAIFELVYDHLTNKKLAYFLLIPGTFLAVLDNNQFTLRSSMIAWIFTYIFVNAFFAIKSNRYMDMKFQLCMMSLMVFIGVWKTEYLYLPCIVLFIDIVCVCAKKLSIKKYGIILLTFAVSYLLFSLPVRIAQPNSNYIFTTILTPLGNAIANNYDDFVSNPELQDEYAIIDNSTPVEKLRDTNRPLNIPWVYGSLPAVSKQNKLEWMIAATKVCMHYWQDALYNRIFVYMHTNGMVRDVINHTGYESEKIVLNLEYREQHLFASYFAYTDPPFGYELRKNVISFIACRNNENYKETNYLYFVTYNSLIPFITLLVLGAIDIAKKRYKELIYIASMCSVVLIIFLLAPADFWMYYMPFYLAAYEYITIKIIRFADQKMKLQ